MSKSLSECSNCFQQFQSHYPYCPYCGGKGEEQLTVGVIFNNTISNYFSVDARFFKSFFPLMFRPGFLAKQFVEGRRRRYLHPAQMYLFISVIFFFLFSFISREQYVTIDNALKKDSEANHVYNDSLKKHQSEILSAQLLLDSLGQSGTKKDAKLSATENIKKSNTSSIGGITFNQATVDSMVQAGNSDEEIYKYMGMKPTDGFVKKRAYKQTLKFLKNRSGGSILQAFYDSIPLAMFIFLPIFALILKVFYFKKGTFAHHLVFSFYYFAFLFMVFSFLVLTNLIWDGLPGWVESLVVFSTFFYLYFGLRYFYNQGYFKSFIKSMAVSFVFLSVVLPFAIFVMATMAFLFY